MNSNGYVMLRRDLFRHVREGLITPSEAWHYTCIIAEADHRTGIWRGSAGLLSSLYGTSPRTCRHILDKLEVKGYIKRFPNPGSHLPYPILVNKYECEDIAGKRARLKATETTDYRQPVYEFCEDVGEVYGKVHGKHIAGTTISKELNKKPKNKTVQFEKPEWVPDEPWHGYMEVRQKRRFPMTTRALTLLCNKLSAFREKGFDPGSLLDEATHRGWNSVWPPRNGDNGNGKYKHKWDDPNYQDPNERAVQSHSGNGQAL